MSGRQAYRAGGPDTVWRDTGAEIVVLDLSTSVYYGLNATGALLWRRLVGGATAEDLVAALRAGTGADPARARADVSAFLDALSAQGLLR